MQCSSCQASLCSGSGLCFYRKINVVDKIEVHLILKPERAAPESFASLVFSGSQVLCKCGAHLGDTVAHDPKRAAHLPFMQQNTTHPAVFQALPNKMPNVIFRRHCRKRQQLFTHALERSRWRSNSGCRDVPEIPNLHEWLWLAECECRRKTDG